MIKIFLELSNTSHKWCLLLVDMGLGKDPLIPHIRRAKFSLCSSPSAPNLNLFKCNMIVLSPITDNVRLLTSGCKTIG